MCGVPRIFEKIRAGVMTATRRDAWRAESRGGRLLLAGTSSSTVVPVIGCQSP
ncbi:long-chain-fatty-acid-CoA ligase [Cutibacterium acnes JCM 18918]|nr:long-chain-fatty-acid-CoA ligase [Cutibacterium acnes JCM 18918]